MTTKDFTAIDRIALGLLNSQLKGAGLKGFNSLSEASYGSQTSYRAEANALLYPPPPLSDQERQIRERAAAALKKHGYSLAAARVLTDGAESGVSTVRNMAYELASEIRPKLTDAELLAIAREAYAKSLEDSGCPNLAKSARAGSEDRSIALKGTLAALKTVGA